MITSGCGVTEREIEPTVSSHCGAKSHPTLMGASGPCKTAQHLRPAHATGDSILFKTNYFENSFLISFFLSKHAYEVMVLV